MIIYNSRTKKEQTVKELKIVNYDMPNKNGEVESVKCVEFVVIGQNREWKDWLLYRDFMNSNENIKI
jgi:hypothetical protein